MSDTSVAHDAHRDDYRRDDYRLLMSCFPTGVAVVTALDAEGAPHGLTCTSLTSVTLSPPTLLVSLSTGSGTLAALRATGAFAVNLLHARGRPAAEIFSSQVPDRFSRLAWRRFGASGCPWLVDNAFAAAECQVSDSMPVGDHEVVFGTVTRLTHTSDLPLLYGMRQFSSWLPRSPAEASTA
jgi:flavin reductase (DIM6/NTAB) family NADH-FMN oxidoreductase RutF